MTSRISLRKMLRLDMRERSWLTILIVIVAFLAIPCFMVIDMKNQTRFLDAASPDFLDDLLRQYETSAYSHLGTDNTLITLCALVGAVLTAFSGFGYLFHREKNDLLQSLAIKRQDQFKVTALSGFLMGVVPYVFMTLVGLFVVCPYFNVFSGDLVITALEAMLFYCLQYTAIYFALLAAIMVTGRFVTGFLLGGFVLLYLPIVLGLIDSLLSTFFKTYYTWAVDRYKLYYYLSPLFVPSDGDVKNRIPLISIIVLAVMVVLFAVLSRRLYVKRPSESAGDALTYRKLLPILKVMITIPASIGGTLVVRAFTGEEGLFWSIFALVMTALLVGCLIEFIESNDVHQCVKNWKTTAASGLVAVIVFMGFQLDLFHYDSYLPSADKIAAMSVSKEYICQNFGEYYNQTGNVDEFCKSLEAETWENFAPLYTLATEGRDLILQQKNNEKVIVEMEAVDTKGYTGNGGYNYTGEIFCFKLKNGRTIYRYYNVLIDSLAQAARTMTEDPAYRKVVYPCEKIEADAFNAVEITNLIDGNDGVTIKLSEAEVEQFIAAIKEDMLSVSIKDVEHEDPVAMLSFRRLTKNGMMERAWLFANISFDVMAVYPQYEHVIDFLNERGFQDMLDNMTYPDVQRMEVSYGDDTYAITDKDAMRRMFDCTRETKWNERYYRDWYLNWYYSYGLQNGYSVYVKDSEAFNSIIEEYGEKISEDEVHTEEAMG